MIRALSLLLPVLVPSWRFFAVVAPSPRIEVAMGAGPSDASLAWQEFRPRPAQISNWESARRLFWNPDWNETLYLTACAERFLADGSASHLEYIVGRVRADLLDNHAPGSSRYFQIRLVAVMGSQGRTQREELYRTDDLALAEESGSS